ncbi:hypothetical protein RRG08_012690 [Elysia crispata]|uniref:Uncharacterized protein n=1 Tax=Elysia crispata TaxID=231223 RepID=A0AAE0YN80_9GAST|nr:hypothetical protein RRG08_012690 [Elysia crispata]
MHKLIASKPKKRLKRTNFTASALQIHKRLDLPDLKPDAPLQTSIDWPSWSQQSHPEIAKDIDGISTKRSMSKSLLRCVTQDMLKEKYPSDHWIRAFTDGSASEAIRDGGADLHRSKRIHPLDLEDYALNALKYNGCSNVICTGSPGAKRLGTIDDCVLFESKVQGITQMPRAVTLEPTCREE